VQGKVQQDQLDQLRNAPIAPAAMIVNGQSVPAQSGLTLDVTSPINGEALTKIPDACTQNGVVEMERAGGSERSAISCTRCAR